MAWSKLVDLELDDEDKLDTVRPIPCETPDYPYGLRICLTNRELDKLGLDDDVAIGDMIDMRCFGSVTSVSKTPDGNGGQCIRIEIQIEKMSVENEMTEDE